MSNKAIDIGELYDYYFYDCHYFCVYKFDENIGRLFIDYQFNISEIREEFENITDWDIYYKD